MSRADHIAEVNKLSRLLGHPGDALAYLSALDAATVRALRERVSDSLFDDTAPLLERVAQGARCSPPRGGRDRRAPLRRDAVRAHRRAARAQAGAPPSRSR